MGTVKSDLVTLINSASAVFTPPNINKIYIPEPDTEQAHTEFGVIILADGSAGLYYAWLGDSQRGMGSRYREEEFVGKSPLDLIPLFTSRDEADSSIGMAAINAITQHLFRHAGYSLPAAGSTMGNLEFRHDDHVGMVGYFPSLVKRLRESGIRLTVIERKTKFMENGNLINVTADTPQLTNCNKVLVTAATLLNDSIDDILNYTTTAEQVVVVGPTAGFLPDPLFARGVTAVGGTEIVRPDSLIEKLRLDQGMGDSARKYLITRPEYPGFDTLISSQVKTKV